MDKQKIDNVGKQLPAIGDFNLLFLGFIMNNFQLFIGADNMTGRVNISITNEVLGEYFDGWNRTNSNGYYKGTREKSINITIFTDRDRNHCIICANILKDRLEQDSIIMIFNTELLFI